MGGAGTGTTQINTPGSKLTSDSWHLGLYMSTPLTSRVFADTMMVFGEGENEIRRTQNLPVVDAFGNTTMTSLGSRTRSRNQEWLVQLGVGAQLADAGSSWSILPSVRFAYAGVKQGAATEKMDSMSSLGIKSDAKTFGTVLMRSGFEIAKDGHLGTMPLRSAANAFWVHDFFVDPRRLGVRWQGASSAPWMISTERRSADSLRLGASLELGLGERRTLRLYGEQEYLNGTKVLRGGVTFTIGF
jgi:outer membrane autotransporter protein